MCDSCVGAVELFPGDAIPYNKQAKNTDKEDTNGANKMCVRTVSIMMYNFHNIYINPKSNV